MNIRLYHPDSIVENSINLLSKEHTHYITNVMRLKRGSNINFFNKEGEWGSEIIFLEKDRVEVKFLKKIRQASVLSKIELAICLVKKTPMETILQKATELGVNKITPIVSERTEVKEINHERAKRIIIEATEQSNQLSPPEISQTLRLKDFLNKFNFKCEINMHVDSSIFIKGNALSNDAYGAFNIANDKLKILGKFKKRVSQLTLKKTKS